jgi:endonuclease/exonuclease/phosphatase family metal-dependent hydrolase
MTVLRLLHANVKAGRYDYAKSWPARRRKRFLEFMAARAAFDLVTLVECEPPACTSLAVSLGMVCVSFRGSAILYNPSTIAHSQSLLRLSFLPAPQTQALVLAEFRVRRTGELFNLGAGHLPPFATRASLRRQQLAGISSRTAGWHDPTILCLDANWSKTLEPFAKARGWTSARTTATTRVHPDYRTSGTRYSKGNPIDYALLRHGARAAVYAVRDGRTWSDHNALELAVTL